MKRALAVLPASLLFLLLMAPVAMADPQEALSGEGLMEAPDKVVTNWGFAILAFFPLFILFMSLVQWRLDKRKDARKAAAKKIKQDWHAGW